MVVPVRYLMGFNEAYKKEEEDSYKSRKKSMEPEEVA